MIKQGIVGESKNGRWKVVGRVELKSKISVIQFVEPA